MATIDFSELSFLIVDDNSYMRRIFSTLLNGFQVRKIEEAASADEALEFLTKQKPDILLVDWEMPDKSGLELVKEVRASEEKTVRFIPILMVSGHSERERVKMARDAGVNDYLVKPISAATLYNHLAVLIMKDQDYVDAPNYFGPDRRFQKDKNYKGPERRSE